MGIAFKGIRFPGMYLQGRGALSKLGEHARGMGTKVFVIADKGLPEQTFEDLNDTLAECEDAELYLNAGACTERAVMKISAIASDHASTVVVGVGGGKTIDIAKAVAEDTSSKCIIVPTIAASDAPCSALSIYYAEDGAVLYARRLLKNPELVLVDTNVIAAAPARFLAAGIADGLATYLEAKACLDSGAGNTFGFSAGVLAMGVAQLCRDTLFRDARNALKDCEQGQAGDAFDRVVEANILLSGIGFESCGVAAAHGVQDALSRLDETHKFLHGEKVSIGILVELLIQNELDEFGRYRDLLASIGLPTTLEGIGCGELGEGTIREVAVDAARPETITHNENLSVTPDLIFEALISLRTS